HEDLLHHPLPPNSDIDIDNHRHVVAQPRAAPRLEGADAEMAHFADPGGRQEDIIDVIGRPVLGAVAPVQGGLVLLAVRLPADRVIGADQTEALLEDANLGRMVDAPAGLIPDRVAVEIACDHRRSLVQEAFVAREPTPQRPELVLADAAGTGVLRPYGQDRESTR